jgi:hypothetical protein
MLIGVMRRVAMGDPQAPFSKVLGILAHAGLLAPNGRLAPDVFLVSMGDHFDWGQTAHREQATAEARELLEWLASHSPEQVVLLAGNHDLARVGELLPFSDADWQQIRAEADDVRDGRADEIDFLRRHPELPSAQVAYRDLATFDVAQRELVLRLLDEGRFRLAYAPRSDLLLSHAGITVDDLQSIGGEATTDATSIAAALNGAFQAALRQWDRRTPLGIPGLHRPGSGAFGEAKGVLFHRNANPDVADDLSPFEGPLRRRYDPRRLVPGVVQGIGHIRDAKCRALLGAWADGTPAVIGPLRSLVVRDGQVRYARGVPAERRANDAVTLFLDGGMAQAEIEEFELLDLDRLQAIMPPSTTMDAPLM